MKKAMKKMVKSSLLLVVMMILLMGCKKENDNENKTTTSTLEAIESTEATTLPTEIAVGFHIEKGVLLDANNEPFVMRGLNHSHTWFQDQLPHIFKTISEKTGSNAVRVVVSNGVEYTKDNQKTIEAIIAQCKRYNIIAVIEVHDGTGKNDASYVEKATDYWIEVKDALIGQEAYAILNIINEWQGNEKADTWAQAYMKAIPRLREAGIKNTIMVDAPGWGQGGKAIIDKGTNVFLADPDRNTMFSIHMYGSAGGSKKKIQETLDAIEGRGLCVAIGEFGYKHTDGDVEEEFLMEYCEENKIGYLAWSWKGNSTDVEYLDISLDWKGRELSPEWGEPLVNGPNGIRKTSKICTVFNETKE